MKFRCSGKSLLFALTLCSLVVPLPAFAGPADDLIKKGDECDQKLQASAALQCYLPAEKLEPSKPALLLRIARQYRHQTADAASLTEKSRLMGMAKSYAERAVSLSPNDGEAHLSLAICYAKSLAFQSNKEKIASLRLVKSSVDQAIALDARQDLAWYILGCWNQRICELSMVKRKMAEVIYGSLPDASDDAAVKCFQKAIALNPNRLIHYIELGRTYAKLGHEAAARKYINQGLAMPDTGKDDPETKQRGRETLAGL
jgi:tetratricopeptide (TPR) repeat protein